MAGQSADMTMPRRRRMGSLRRVMPGLDVPATYQKDWFGKDVIAGVVLATLLVPQGMAYAELAGLPAITGLYTTVLCLLAYAVFGPSRILVLGPDSALGPMIAATVLPLVASDGDPQKAVALASLLAIMVGLIMVLASVAKFGFIADLISKPTMIGYMNGLAITILVGQLPKLFGFKVESENFVGDLVGFVEGVANGETVVAAAAVGIAGIVLILALQQWLPKVPAVLVMVVLAIAATSFFGLADKGVSLVGELPRGFPPFTIPDVTLSDIGLMFAGALGIALVSLTDTISNSTAFAARSGQEVHGNQEMIGIGAANLAAGFFQGFPVSSSGSRSAVAERSGSKTQLTGVTGAVLVLLMLVLVPGLFRNLPQPALAAVVITAVRVPGRRPGDGASLAPEQVRVQPVARCLPWGCFPGGAGGHRHCRGAVHSQYLPPRMVAVRDGDRVGSGIRGVSRCELPSGREAPAGPGDLPVGRSDILRQRQAVP